MTAISFTTFHGMIPRYGDQQIPNSAASRAVNCDLLSGELRPMRMSTVAVDLRSRAGAINRVFRLPYSGGYIWHSTSDGTLDLLKGPLVNDAYDRYYSTSEIDVPRMNTAARINSSSAFYRLGIPAPTKILTVSPSGGSGVTVTRAYTYTYVSAYGEEGAPVAATIATGKDDGTWALGNIGTSSDIANFSERNITKVNIYRTVTDANGQTEYHYVTQINLGTTTHNDTAATTAVALNDVLASETWAPPPAGLRGIIAHPNGFLVGFSGRDLYFSEPYRPHAWPADYVLSTKDEIVGLGVFGTTVVVATTGFPYMATGVRPDAITFIQADTPEPCRASRRAIVSMPYGVYYPTDNGLLLASPAGFVNATKGLITKSEWTNDYRYYNIKAVRWQSQYVAFTEPQVGFMFSPDEPAAAFVELGNGAWTQTAVSNDNFSGDVFILHNKVVYYWNPPSGSPMGCLWKSKEVITPKPVNFGAFKVEFSDVNEVTAEEIADAQAENAIRGAFPLNPINFSALNRVRKMSEMPGYAGIDGAAENSQATHKSPLYDIAAMQAASQALFLTVRVFADGEEVAEVQVIDEEVYRLPEGYKAKEWYFEIEGNVAVRSLKIAETSKELATV